MLFKYMFLLIIVMLIIFLYGCSNKKTLDLQLSQIVMENCYCDTDTCSCTDPYLKNNVVYLDCRNVTVSSIGDVLSKCSYWSEINGWHSAKKV